MSDDITVGVVGGSGATGKVVVAELWKSTRWKIQIGGRSLDQAKTLASEFDQRVSAARLDVLDGSSLDKFCSRCSLVLNCAGPVSVLQDRVAQSAFRNRCHYVDPAGMSFVKERMLPHDREIVDLGLSFVGSAGWIPGISELLPVYAHARASATMDSIESVTTYYGDSGEWSINALRDMVAFLRRAGLRRPRYFSKGEPVHARARQASPKIDLGGRIGLRRFSLYSMPELDAVGRRLKTCNFFTYAYLPSPRIALTAALVASLPLPKELSVRLLQNGFRSVLLPVGGFVTVQVRGRSHGQSQLLTVQIVYDKHRDYWIHGLTLATVARMVANREGVQPGVNFLTEAIDPTALMAELQNAGIEHTERLETCDSSA